MYRQYNNDIYIHTHMIYPNKIQTMQVFKIRTRNLTGKKFI